jgi:hypothetical protein
MGVFGPGLWIGGPTCAKAAVEANSMNARRKRVTFFMVEPLYEIVGYKLEKTSDGLTYIQGT